MHRITEEEVREVCDDGGFFAVGNCYSCSEVFQRGEEGGNLVRDANSIRKESRLGQKKEINLEKIHEQVRGHLGNNSLLIQSWELQ